MVLICQWFAPTQFVITTEGMDDSMVVKDDTGQVVGLQLPEKLVVMANHQVYLDWWYLWAFTYFLNMHEYVLIMLKKSLKWIPVVGWGMQFFEFIFLARSWASDRLILEKELTRTGENVQRRKEPLFLMIFPEGTLVSKDTRPLSKKYADKVGIEDMTHTLLPRSTGLLFSLRTLSPYIPSLHLLDVTIGYPGVPPAGFGQSFYTLRSVFFQNIPPPAVHLHLRLYEVERDVPIGAVSPQGQGQAKVDATEPEKAIFDKWLTDRWREKDDLMDGFYKDGKFMSVDDKPKHSSAEATQCVGNDLDVKQTNGNGHHAKKGNDSWVIPIEVSLTGITIPEPTKSFGGGGYCDLLQGYHGATGLKLALKRLRVSGPQESLAEVSDATYLVSPWVDYGDLSRFVTCRVQYLNMDSGEQESQCRIDLYRKFREHDVIAGIALGLAYLHALDVIHGDLKAANILLDDALRPKICDFGMSKVLHTEYEATSAGLKGGGSWRWKSPEMMEDGSVKTTASDVYAFGITIAEVLSAELPFSRHRSPFTIARAVTKGDRPLPIPISREGHSFEDLWNTARSCWASDPTVRPPAARIADALARGYDGNAARVT
ncbi:hypothetical protein FRB98_005314 [Tulasnella sp. 332]|nr:hypothetical protein FRB98_005314 [Tulasnella sp. 332]